MAIKFSCTCGAVMEAPDDKAGATTRCPCCGQRVYVPYRELPPSPPRELPDEVQCRCGAPVIFVETQIGAQAPCQTCGLLWEMTPRGPEPVTPPPIKCPGCTQYAPAMAAFCPHCGQALGAAELPGKEEKPAAPKAAGRPGRKAGPRNRQREKRSPAPTLGEPAPAGSSPPKPTPDEPPGSEKTLIPLYLAAVLDRAATFSLSVGVLATVCTGFLAVFMRFYFAEGELQDLSAIARCFALFPTLGKILSVGSVVALIGVGIAAAARLLSFRTATAPLATAVVAAVCAVVVLLGSRQKGKLWTPLKAQAEVVTARWRLEQLVRRAHEFANAVPSGRFPASLEELLQGPKAEEVNDAAASSFFAQPFGTAEMRQDQDLFPEGSIGQCPVRKEPFELVSGFDRNSARGRKVVLYSPGAEYQLAGGGKRRAVAFANRMVELLEEDRFQSALAETLSALGKASKGN